MTTKHETTHHGKSEPAVETGKHGSGKLGKAHHSEGDLSPLSGEAEHPNEPDTAKTPLPSIKVPMEDKDVDYAERVRHATFQSGDKVQFKSGATCYVQTLNENGTYSVTTDDYKHAFNCDEGDLELIAVAAEATKEYQPPTRREPIQESNKTKDQAKSEHKEQEGKKGKDPAIFKPRSATETKSHSKK